MRTSALLGTENIGFFEIYSVSARTMGIEQCGHFSDKLGGGGQFFAILCERSFMDGS